MQATVSNCGQFSRLSHRRGSPWVYQTLAPGSLRLSATPLALPSSSRSGNLNLNAAALSYAVLSVGWQPPWLRLLIEITLAVVGAVVIWQLVASRLRLVEKSSGARARSARFLVRERNRRLLAQRQSNNLTRRILTAHEDERKRLARELHDDITQRLARLAIDAAQAERGVPSAPDSNTWRRIREQLVRLSGDVHSLAYQLHPSILHDLGLVEALRTECSRFSRRESIPVKVESRDVPDKISDDVALCLFRIGQESLRNVARHAHASAVEVLLVGRDGGLQFVVHDNGIGFKPAQGRERASLGLASMKERIGLVIGEMDCESEPGHGTTIVAWVPLQEALES